MRVFSGDHGDQPQPGEVMLWAQWDDRPILVINNDGEYVSAILVKESCPSERHAIACARQDLKGWADAQSERDYFRGELDSLRAELAAAMAKIDTYRAFGWPDRVAETVDRIGQLL